MLLVNLRMEPDVVGFSAEQSRAVVEVARFVVAENDWGPDDPVNVESIAIIERAWNGSAA